MASKVGGGQGSGQKAKGGRKAPDVKMTDAEKLLFTHPSHLIRLLQQKSWAIFLEEASAFDITPPQYTALMVIREHPDIDQLSLGMALGYDRTTIGGLAERLEEKSLINRKVADHDRRARNLTITQAGRKLIDQLLVVGTRVSDRLLNNLSAQERVQWHQMMLRLLEEGNSSTPAENLAKARERHDSIQRDIKRPARGRKTA